MTVLERRKGSFITALPERLLEASKITVESPRNHMWALASPPGARLLGLLRMEPPGRRRRG